MELQAAEASDCNFTYSLLGIETGIDAFDAWVSEIAISLTPYQGLKHRLMDRQIRQKPIAISLTPYQGLKLASTRLYYCLPDCNFTYSLLGIETFSINQQKSKPKPGEIAISLTPYQGLKQTRIRGRYRILLIAISLTPYQGLKLQGASI